MAEMIGKNVLLTESMHERLKEEKKRSGNNGNTTIRIALEAYLKKQEKA